MRPDVRHEPCRDALANAAARAAEAAVVLRQCADLRHTETVRTHADLPLEEAVAACADGTAVMAATADVVGRATPDRCDDAIAVAHAALAVAQRAATSTAAVQDLDERLRSAANALRRADSALRTMLADCGGSIDERAS